MPELDQPLMVVVVLMVNARAAGAARVAGLFFTGKGSAADMGSHCSETMRDSGLRGCF